MLQLLTTAPVQAMVLNITDVVNRQGTKSPTPGSRDRVENDTRNEKVGFKCEHTPQKIPQRYRRSRADSGSVAVRARNGDLGSTSFQRLLTLCKDEEKRDELPDFI